MYSSSYKNKSKFYNTLDIDIDLRKLLKKYHVAKDQIIKGKLIYFTKKDKQK